MTQTSTRRQRVERPPRRLVADGPVTCDGARAADPVYPGIGPEIVRLRGVENVYKLFTRPARTEPSESGIDTRRLACGDLSFSQIGIPAQRNMKDLRQRQVVGAERREDRPLDAIKHHAIAT